MNITLSSEARRKLGGKFAPRVRHPDEAPPRDCDLFARPILTLADMGAPQYLRPGATDALGVPSRGPFNGGAS